MNTTRQIQIRRPSHVVATELRSMILRGDLDGTERLPSEPDFALQLGVSRYHLREALRLLEQDGLIEVRSGRNGGIFLTVPKVEVLTRTFAGILARQDTTLADLFAARLVIEPAAAELAATSVTEDELKAIAQTLERQDEDGYNSQVNSLFHVQVAAGAHNHTLLLMMRSIESIVQDIDLLATQRSAAFGNGSARAHRAILRALEARDGPSAKDLMTRHLVGFEATLEASGIDLQTLTVGALMEAATPVTRA